MIDDFDAFLAMLSRRTPEQREQEERRCAEQKAIEERTLQVRAILTVVRTGQTHIVMVGAYPKGEYLYLVGGPTGYESMLLDELPASIASGSWVACLGAEDRWHRLEVPGTELKRIREHLKMLKTPGGKP
jgi:hypothetical protein